MCFTVQLSKIVFRIAVCLKQLCYYIMLFSACQELFSTFFRSCFCLSRSNFEILSHPTGCCQELFSFLFSSFVISVRSLRRNSDRIALLPIFVNMFFHIFSNFFVSIVCLLINCFFRYLNCPPHSTTATSLSVRSSLVLKVKSLVTSFTSTVLVGI